MGIADWFGCGRRWTRALSFIAGCAAVAACSDSSPTNGIAPGHARLSLAPRFATTPSGGPVVALSRIDAYLIPPAGDSTFATAAFVEGSATLSFDVPIPGGETEFTLDLTGFDANGVAVYHARQTYVLRPGDNDLPQPELVYSAPDSKVTAISISPSPISVDVGGTGSLSVTGFGPDETTISPVLVGWTSRNTAILTVDDNGTITGVAKGQTYVVARTATDIADSSLVTVAAFAILPEKTEKLPNGTQQFSVVAGGTGPFTWSVNGATGGNSTFGTISSTGFYAAPAKVPEPSTFSVCAAVTARPGSSVCASVTINPVPTSGADVIVFNDINFMDDGYAATNAQLFKNLAVYPSTGTRSTATAFMRFRGHASKCGSTGECGATSQLAFADTLKAIQIPVVEVDDSEATLTTIPPEIKTILLLNPTTPFTNAEINALKQFSSEGGRIIFVGEHAGYYGEFIDPVENDFLSKMGAVLRNPGKTLGSGLYACSGNGTVSGSDIRPHQVTTALNAVTFACSTEVILGPNDYALLTITEENALRVLAAVAKVDLTPLPPDQPGAVRSANAHVDRRPTTTKAILGCYNSKSVIPRCRAVP